MKPPLEHNHLHNFIKWEPDLLAELPFTGDLPVELIYFWDESREVHLGEGWVVDYIIMGLSFGTGLAASSLLTAYFGKAGEAAWSATVAFIKKAAQKLNRQRIFKSFGTIQRMQLFLNQHRLQIVLLDLLKWDLDLPSCPANFQILALARG